LEFYLDFRYDPEKPGLLNSASPATQCSRDPRGDPTIRSGDAVSDAGCAPILQPLTNRITVSKIISSQ